MKLRPHRLSPLFAAVMAVQPGCGSTRAERTNGGSGQRVETAGTLVYSDNTLSVIRDASGSPGFVATITGLSTVEILTVRSGAFQATPLQAPPIAQSACAVRTPVAACVVDVNGDGLDDIAISDPCGNWVALQGARSTRRRSSRAGSLK